MRTELHCVKAEGCNAGSWRSSWLVASTVGMKLEARGFGYQGENGKLGEELQKLEKMS